MVRRCFPVAKIVGSSPTGVVRLLMSFWLCLWSFFAQVRVREIGRGFVASRAMPTITLATPNEQLSYTLLLHLIPVSFFISYECVRHVCEEQHSLHAARVVSHPMYVELKQELTFVDLAAQLHALNGLLLSQRIRAIVDSHFKMDQQTINLNVAPTQPHPSSRSRCQSPQRTTTQSSRKQT
jgi:hypothetical protein